MSDLIKQYMQQKYGENYEQDAQDKYDDRSDSLNTAGLFSNLGDVIAGNKIGSANDYFSGLKKQAKEDTLGKLDSAKKSYMADESLNSQMKDSKNKQDAFDSSSSQSQSYRKMIEKNFPDVAKSYGDSWNNVSAGDQDAIFKPLQLKENIEARKQAASIDRAAKTVAPKAAQSLATGFGKRLEQAEDVFSTLEQSGYDRSDISAGLGSMLPNVARTSNSQRQSQAERNFINAVLRRESGAAISPTEFENGEIQYFPRAGDSPEVMTQKKNNRLQVLGSMKNESGTEWDKVKLITESKPQKAAQDSKAQTVTQGGHTYTLNPQTGEYE